jgi:hypothetical protein
MDDHPRHRRAPKSEEILSLVRDVTARARAYFVPDDPTTLITDEDLVILRSLGIAWSADA